MIWLVLLVLIAGGVFVYRWLVQVESEIRREIGAGDDVVTAPETETSSRVSSPIDPGGSFADRIVAAIRTEPGILQKDLYLLFPDVDKKQIQKELLRLDRSGRISRNRSGNTFALHLSRR